MKNTWIQIFRILLEAFFCILFHHQSYIWDLKNMQTLEKCLIIYLHNTHLPDINADSDHWSEILDYKKGFKNKKSFFTGKTKLVEKDIIKKIFWNDGHI